MTGHRSASDDKACRDLAELRSAYVDGALERPDEQKLLRHLSDCDACRNDIADLRAVRALLSRGTRSDSDNTSPDLSHRLVSIAGRDADAPLWTRPFRRTRACDSLPSTRRTVRRRITAATIAVGVLVAGSAGVGYAAAPPMEVAAVADPSNGARADFSSVMAQLPLANDSVNAVMMVSGSGLETSGARHSTSGATRATGPTIDSDAAIASLQRAVSAGTTVAYSGEQQVTAPRNGRTIAARVNVAFQPGQGSQLQVHNARGRKLVEGFVPTPATSRIVNDEVLTSLVTHFNLSGQREGSAAGRPATVITATDPGSDRVQARWWIDDSSGLLLWQETYDGDEQLVQSAGFTSVDVSDNEVFMDHLAPRLAVPTTTSTLTLSSVGVLANQGWICEDELAGMSLIRLRAGGDEASAAGVLHMVYSDGLSTISVFEQRGAMTSPPAGSTWDANLRAYVREGVPSIASWQSGGTVFTVVTDGPSTALSSAVGTLPHQEPLSRTNMERVQAGWARILDLVNG